MLAGDRFSPAYKRYMLVMTTLIYTVNLLDRGLMGMLLQPIKEDLQLTDSQLGFVTGIAFGLFYAILGVPIARWADRGNRVSINSIAIGLWSFTVMICLWVGSFAQLVFARLLAGVGESGCRPPTYSLIGDYFPKAEERTRAMYVLDMSAPLATIISFGAAGWLNEVYGWRMTFFLIAIPGLILAVLFKWTVIEPRVQAGLSPVLMPAAVPMKTVLTTLWGQPTSRHLTVSTIILFTMGQGLGPWYAAFMIRSHGMSTGELGLWLGLVLGVSGLVGLMLGSYIVSRWFRGDEAGQLRGGVLTCLLAIPCFIAFLLVPDKYWALIALIPHSLLLYCFLSPVFAFFQRLVAPQMRATVYAVVLLLANLIGMGLGPQLVGVLSDVLTPRLDIEGLRYAMLVVSLLMAWSAYHLWMASKTIKADLSRAALAFGSPDETSKSA